MRCLLSDDLLTERAAGRVDVIDADHGEGCCPVMSSADASWPGQLPSGSSSKLGEHCGEADRGRAIEPQFVVAAAQVLDEGVPGDDNLSCPIDLQPALR
jgi:hypothetical protein